MSEAIDRINLRTMRDPAVVAHYARPWGLSPAEQATFARVAPLARGRRILDIGVGGGRTVEALRAISDDYLGIDYSVDMVEACRRRFPAAQFEFADARAMDGIADGSVGLAVFACNGIGMVSHADRLRILREVQRVLEPGGLFVFSTHNRNSPEFGRGFRWPSFEWSWHPLRAAVRSLRFCGEFVLRLRNRRHFRPFEVHAPDYAIINDQCHHYGTMLYYVTLDRQRRQLAEAGFEPDAEAYDLAGEPIHDDSAHDSITLIARKPLAYDPTGTAVIAAAQPVAG
ncbi:class I SAM-dependent methyltransferase [Luteimonas kalidii]|uniref:Class I SAM-dependent methyltransferase n=1 Tax=Luteimonas kalidii TaxID=3042025 RepID=A0ABT6JZP1_9GAMM|nr:class I SAM-dependent methyltransferase [Luteimonas kalidii]MDH5835701.1 class I SAM-dependent methyltransferase [Luteimonas kalidii]